MSIVWSVNTKVECISSNDTMTKKSCMILKPHNFYSHVFYLAPFYNIYV